MTEAENMFVNEISRDLATRLVDEAIDARMPTGIALMAAEVFAARVLGAVSDPADRVENARRFGVNVQRFVTEVHNAKLAGHH